MNEKGASIHHSREESMSFLGVLVGMMLLMMVKLRNIPSFVKWALVLSGIALIFFSGKKLLNS